MQQRIGAAILARHPAIIFVKLVCLALLITAWFYLWRYAYLYPDDLRFGTNFGKHQFGDSPLTELFSRLKQDLLHRNGRIGDVIVTFLFLLPLPWRSTMALVCTLETLCLAGIIWQARKWVGEFGAVPSTRPRTVKIDDARRMTSNGTPRMPAISGTEIVAITLCALIIILSVGALDPLQVGRFIFWPAANVNYLFPSIFLYPVVRYIVTGGKPWAGIVAGICTVLACLTIELVAVAISAFCLLIVFRAALTHYRHSGANLGLLRQTWQQVPHRWLILTAWAATVAELAFPGHYQRLGTEPGTDSGTQTLMNEGVRFVNSATVTSLWLAPVTCTLIFAIMLSARQVRLYARILVVAGAVVLTGITMLLRQHRVTQILGERSDADLFVMLRSTQASLGLTAVALAMATLACIGAGLAVSCVLESRLRTLTLRVWGAGLAGCVIPFLVHSTVARAYFALPLALSVVTAVILLISVFPEKSVPPRACATNRATRAGAHVPGYAAYALVIVLAITAGLCGWRVEHALSARAEIYEPVFAQLEAGSAAPTQIQVPLLPCAKPYRGTTIWFDSHTHENLYRAAYGLPASTRFVREPDIPNTCVP